MIKFKKPAFTLIELIISVALLIVALSIALFAVVGSNGLIQKTEARGVISEGGRSVTDVIRRSIDNAPVGGVSLVSAYDANSFAAIRIKTFSDNRIVCTTIGRATTTLVGGEEQYELSTTGTIVALKIHSVDIGGVCPLVTSPATYQNRLTSIQANVTDLRFSIQNLVCGTPSSTCVAKQFLRYSLALEQAIKSTGGTAEARRPSLSLLDGLPIGLVNETLNTLTVETLSLPNGTVGTAYLQTLTSSGGVPSYTWSISAGSLPTGLTINAGSGVISGTPSIAGTFNFTARIQDSQATSATKALSITIAAAASPVTISTTALNPSNATETQAYTSAALIATGGSGGYVWSIDSVSPAAAWLSIGSSSGVITGTPPSGASSGSPFTITVRVRDSADANNTATKNLTLTIGTSGGSSGGGSSE